MEKYKIKDICTILNGRAYKYEELQDSGKYRILRVGNFFSKDDWYYSDMELDDNKYCYDGDLLYAWSANFGPKIWEGEKTIYHYHIWKVIPNENVDKMFLYYKLYSITDRLKDSSHGSVMLHLTKSDMENFEIELPKLDQQKKIGKILKNIDDKIKLNTEINNNLYELAIKYLNEMQSDEEVTLSKFGKIQGGYAFKSKDLLNTKTNNRIIKIKNLRNEISADVINSQFVENEVIDKLDNKFKIKKGNVVIAMTGAELGKTGFIYGFDHYYLNQRVGLVRGITKEKELYLNILLLSQEFQDLLNSKGYGSAQPNVSTADIENITIQNIEDDDLMKFYEKVSPIYKKIILNCEENLNLEQLRNTLLPKLMNGEIDLYNIEI